MEKRVPDQSWEILTTIQRNSGGYSVFTRDGRVFNFDPSGAMERMGDISEKINQSPGRGQPQVTLNSIIQASNGNLIITGKNYANIWQPLLIAGLSQNGTFLWEKTYDGYEIFYQSHEQSNSSYGNIPVVTVYAQLDTNGKVVQQNLPKNNSELPPWLFYQNGPELVSPMNESALNTIIPGSSQGTPLFRSDSLLKTDDDGVALLGTRYS